MKGPLGVYVGIAYFLSFLVYGWVFHEASQIAIPTLKPTHIHVTLP
jgi:hypothetical protein